MTGVVAISLARRGALASGIKLLASRATLLNFSEQTAAEGCLPLSVSCVHFVATLSRLVFTMLERLRALNRVNDRTGICTRVV